MRMVHVALGNRSYDIEIGQGLLPQMGAKIHALLPQAETVAIVTDSNIGPLYADALRRGLEAAGVKAPVLTFAAGEESKNLTTLGQLYEGLAKAGVTRSDAVVALGGGVTGDMAGLAAATFLRGVAFVQVPTSLLATVDSSVGGKVAVDLPCGKNLVGAFLQPKAVYIDTDLLQTLPARFLHDGMAEVIKYGCIFDAQLFADLGRIHSDEELLAAAEGIIERCCNHKARVVEEDERETGRRMLLNFGHTLGHAVEKAFHYETYSHGEAVGIGMVLLTQRTEALGLTEAGTADRIAALLQQYNLPTDVQLPQQEFLQTIAMDKKKRGDSLTLIVLRKIGEGFLHKVAFRDLPAYLPEEEGHDER
jgi:3-dehydroquinate synthase